MNATWEVIWPGMTAESDGSTVRCSDPEIEAAVRSLLADGPVAVTPTGPWVSPPDPAATYLALQQVLTSRGITDRGVYVGPSPGVEMPDHNAEVEY